jgi:hypothetical protein
MHKKISYLLSIQLIAYAVQAQPMQDFFKKDVSAVWIGVDFSEARYYGEAATVSAKEMKNVFPAINELVVYEPERYKIGKTFRKNFLENDISYTRLMNEQVDERKIIVKNEDSLLHLNKDRIIELAQRYQFEKRYGFAIVFFMEGMNKTKEEATIWVAVIRMSDKEVIITRRLRGEAGGISFRNHWSRPVLEVLNTIYKSEYSRWKKDISAMNEARK